MRSSWFYGLLIQRENEELREGSLPTISKSFLCVCDSFLISHHSTPLILLSSALHRLADAHFACLTALLAVLLISNASSIFLGDTFLMPLMEFIFLLFLILSSLKIKDVLKKKDKIIYIFSYYTQTLFSNGSTQIIYTQLILIN